MDGQENEPIHRHRYIILFIVLTGVFMSVLDSVVVNIALPTITSHFSVNVADSQWVVTTYLIVQTSFLIICAKISERVGKARMFKTGMVVFAISSLLCGLSADLNQLIMFRVAQGLGASMMFSIAAAINFQVFPARERGKAMGYLGSAVAAASMIGPVLGGFIVGTIGWRYIFLINVPIGLAVFVIAMRMLKLEDQKAAKFDIDYIGAMLWVMSVLSLVLFLGELAASLDLTITASTYFLTFAVSFASFILWERRAAHPLLDLSVFRVKRFSYAGFSMMLFFISMILVTAIGPFYFEGVMDMGPEEVGLVFMVMPAVLVFGSPLTGKMYDRTHSRYYSPLGHAVRAASLLLMAYAMLERDLLVILAAFAFMGVGSALFQSPNNTEVMVALPREKSGTASSLSATLRNLGMALGVSIGTIMLTLTFGSSNYDIAAGGPMVGTLAEAVGMVMVAAAMVSIVGAVLSLIGNNERARSEPARFIDEAGHAPPH